MKLLSVSWVLLFAAFDGGCKTQKPSTGAKEAGGSSPSGEEFADLASSYPSYVKSFADLDEGNTHFEHRRVGSRTVVMVHGVSGPLHVWDRTVPQLIAAGYTTLRLDLYGRGFSERIDSDYDLDTYINQLKALLDHLSIDHPITLMGSSMGAIVVSEFARRYPRQIEQMALLGPAGFPIQVPFLARFRDVPILGDLLFRLVGHRVIMQQNRDYFFDEEQGAELLEFFEAQLEIPWTGNAILQTLRNVPLQDYVDQYQEVGRLTIPTLIVWGEEDVTFPFEHHVTLREAIPHAEFLQVPESAHLPMYEAPNVVGRRLLQFLGSGT